MRRRHPERRTRGDRSRDWRPSSKIHPCANGSSGTPSSGRSSISIRPWRRRHCSTISASRPGRSAPRKPVDSSARAQLHTSQARIDAEPPEDRAGLRLRRAWRPGQRLSAPQVPRGARPRLPHGGVAQALERRERPPARKPRVWSGSTRSPGWRRRRSPRTACCRCLSAGIADLPCVADADIVNLQLLHNAQFFSLLQLPGLSRRRRVILSVHDMFLFTGHCVYSLDCERWKTGCGSCPDLGDSVSHALRHDGRELEAQALGVRSLQSRSRGGIAVAGRAGQEKPDPRASSRCTTFPYGVDTRVYKILDKVGNPRKAGTSPRRGRNLISLRAARHQL